MAGAAAGRRARGAAGGAAGLAVAAPAAGGSPADAPRRRRSRAGARAMIRFDAVTVTYAGRAAAGASRRSPAGDRRGRAVPGGRPHRHAASPRCSARSTGWCRTSPAAGWPAGSPWPACDTRSAPPRELAHVGRRGRPGPARRLRDRHGRGRARVRDGAAGRATGRDAQAGRGDARPARHRRAAPPSTADTVRRAAAAGRDRRGAHRAPAVLVLDEPTSALDPTAAEDVLAAITRLVHDLGVTVVVAEHRLERVVQYADRMVLLTGDGRRAVRRPRRRCWPIAGRAAGGRARPAGRLGAAAAVGPGRPPPGRPASRDRLAGLDAAPAGVRLRTVSCCRPAASSVRYGDDRWPSGDVDLDLRAGEVVALMGRNGSGKSSLLWALQGSGPRHARHRRVSDGDGPGSCRADEARRHVGLVPQTPGDLLYLDTVAAECEQADREPAAPPARRGPPRRARRRASPGDRHPRDLSEGQRLALVLAIQLAAAPVGGPARRADPRPGLPGQAAPRAHPATLADRGHGGGRGDPRRRVRGGDRRPGGGAGRGRGRRATDRPEQIVVASPAFAPQVAKVLGAGLADRRPGARRAAPARRGERAPYRDRADAARCRSPATGRFRSWRAGSAIAASLPSSGRC